jgi:hypothetical protein
MMIIILQESISLIIEGVATAAAITVSESSIGRFKRENFQVVRVQELVSTTKISSLSVVRNISRQKAKFAKKMCETVSWESNLFSLLLALFFCFSIVCAACIVDGISTTPHE